MSKNRHVHLVNEKSTNVKFKRQRGRGKEAKEVEVDEVTPKYIHEFRKRRLRVYLDTYNSKRAARARARTINTGYNVDFIRVSFLSVFNDDLRNKFYSTYGLSPVEYSDFNRSVIFEIIYTELFRNFESHLSNIITSEDGTEYRGKAYNLLALVYNFEFVDSAFRVRTADLNGIVLSLASSSFDLAYSAQKRSLAAYLSAINASIKNFETVPGIIEIDGLDINQIQTIADNFDIVKGITSSRALELRPGIYGDVRREFGFSVTTKANLAIVGVIDTGISRIEPLRDVLTNICYDHSGNGAFWDEAGHGTLVAGLIVLGDEFLKEVKSEYSAKAKVAVIKALHHVNGTLTISRIIEDIRDARRRHGIRIFNMSLNMPFAKQYNEGYSLFAYELDKLAFEEDILVFISVGNIDADYLRELVLEERHVDHEYPLFFFNPNGTSEFHLCGNTNISEPAESLNNISVGALAGNLEEGDNSDLTPSSMYPAFYTRKFHVDFSRPINSVQLKANQINKNLNKPDLVFDGGDLFEYESGIEVLRSPLSDSEKFYGRTCGTSLSTPLVASYAAEILNEYPTLRMQTVKALIINNSSFNKRSNLPHFSNSSDSLLKSMTGYGKPDREFMLGTDDNSIIFVIEQSIRLGQMQKIPLNLPAYLARKGNKLKFKMTLCYSFLPVKDNHLNYLPIHISFNLVQNLDVGTIATANQTEYGIKSGFGWSEDHYSIEGRLFSNSQSATYILQPKDLEQLNGSVAIAVRCLGKSEIPSIDHDRLKSSNHQFSLIISISEISTNDLSGMLYSEMINSNDVESIGDLQTDTDIDLDV